MATYTLQEIRDMLEKYYEGDCDPLFSCYAIVIEQLLEMIPAPIDLSEYPKTFTITDFPAWVNDFKPFLPDDEND